jgi:hypothetical protein
MLALLPLLLLFAAPAARAQQTARIKLGSLDKFAASAVEVVIKEETPKSGGGKVYVRHFEFDSAGAYTEADLAEIRAQVAGAGWSRILKVQERDDAPEENESVEVYVYGDADGKNVYGGMTVISTQLKEFTVVNIVGQSDINGYVKRLKVEKRTQP